MEQLLGMLQHYQSIDSGEKPMELSLNTLFSGTSSASSYFVAPKKTTLLLQCFFPTISTRLICRILLLPCKSFTHESNLPVPVLFRSILNVFFPVLYQNYLQLFVRSCYSRFNFHLADSYCLRTTWEFLYWFSRKGCRIFFLHLRTRWSFRVICSF